MLYKINDSEKLWDKFREKFEKVLRELDQDRFSKDWHETTKRTQLFRECIEKTSDDLGLKFITEFLAIDFVLMDKDNHVPVIAIESENDPSSVKNDEIAKLCAVAAPLRILLTVTFWDPSSGWDRKSNDKSKYLAIWENEVRNRLNAWPHPGSFGLIVGERGQGGNTKFYSYLFDHEGSNEFRSTGVQTI